MTTLVSKMPHTVHTPSSLMLLSSSAHPFFCYPFRNERGVARRTLLLTYANGQCQLSSAAKADLCLSISVWVPKMTNRLYTVERKMKQHKIPLGFESSNCSDETAAVLCCNQRNEYTIPIVTLTCNHARQFRTTRTP